MKNKFPEIYKNKINNIKSKVQTDYYYQFGSNEKSDQRKDTKETKIDKSELIQKINNIFTRPDYVYQADINIMYKNGKNIEKKVVGFKDNYLLTLDNERIPIDDILDVK